MLNNKNIDYTNQCIKFNICLIKIFIMRKLTLLGLLLLSAIGFVANAQTYSWSIAEGSEVKEFSEVTLTVSGITGTIDGNYGNTMSCGLYRKSDNYQLSGFGWSWCPYYIDVVDGTATFTLPVQSDAVYPDYPVRTDGEYYVKINEGFFWFDAYTDAQTESPELILNFTIKTDPKFVAKSDFTVSPEEGIIKQCPEAWVFNITNPEVTSVTLASDANIKFFRDSYSQYELIPELSNNGKTITLYPSDELIKRFSEFYEGVYKVIFFDGALIFNGDDSNRSGLLQFEYEIPVLAGYNQSMTFPTPPTTRWDSDLQQDVEVPSIVSKLDRIELYVQEYQPTLELPAVAADNSNRFSIQRKDSEGNWAHFVYLDAEITPYNETRSYAGVILTPPAGTEYAEGEYKVVAPIGAIIVNIAATDWDPAQRLETKYFEVKYTVKPAPAISTTPVWSIAEGTELESFTDVVLTFAGLTSVEFADKYNSEHAIMLYRINDDGSKKGLGRLSAGYENESTDWKTVIEVDANGGFEIYANESNFAPFYPIDIDGNYRIELPRGVFKFDGFNDIVNEASVLNFSVKTSSILKQAETVLDPAPCAITDYLDKITVTFTNEAIETLEVGEVPTSTGQWEVDENGVWYEVYVDKPAKAQLIQTLSASSWPTGQYYLIEVDPENPNQIILTPDPETIYDDSVLQYGSYSLRIPRGGIVANKGTETECASSVLEFGQYDHEQFYYGEIYSPVPGDVVEINTFRLKYKDANGNDAWGAEIVPGDAAPELYIYSLASSEWVLHSTLIAEVSLDGTNGQTVPTVKVPAEPITAGGKYKVVIPRGAFLYKDYGGNAVRTEALEAEYNVVSNIDPAVAFTPTTVTPAEGIVEELSEIKLVFDKSYFPNGIIGTGPKVKVYDEEGNVCAEPAISVPTSQREVSAKITFMEKLTEVAEYVVVIEEGMLQDYSNAELVNPEIRLTYKVRGSAQIKLVMDPKAGNKSDFSDMGVLDSIEDGTLTIKIEGATKFDVIEINPEFLVPSDDSYKMIILYDVDYDFNAGEKSVALYPVLKEGTTNEFSLVRFEGSGTEWPITSNGAGYFWLSIPNGAFTVNGVPTYYYSFNYIISETNPFEIVMTVTPQGGDDFANAPTLEVVDDSTFSIKFEGDNLQSVGISSSILDWEESEVFISLWDIDDEWNMGDKSINLYPVLKEGTTNEFSLVKFEESGSEWPITTPGAGYFCLNIPESSFIVNSFPTEEYQVIYRFTGTGVEAVDMDAQDLVVYSINGMLIKRNASWREVLNFEPGIYIVNGEKIYIRK